MFFMKYTLLTTLLATGAFTAFGVELTPEQALERAMSDMPLSMRMSAPAMQKATLRYTVKAQNHPTVYVFDRGAGYMVVSADDATSALLGYSTTGRLSENNINPSLRYWLNEYSRQIDFARQNPVTAKRSTTQRTIKAAIEPMTKTKWNQDAPYNDDCPVFDGERSVTGCVATALAQVMKYHNYPEKGIGSHSYTYKDSTFSVDYAATTYNWADMLDVYTSAATEAQKAAVATLMYSCGVAVDMQYSPTDSGAQSIKVASAVINYFGYDKSARCIPRDPFGLYEWEDMVYENLTTYGPVQYSGQSADGGHSFVCDGYQGDGYFHINWGWGGMSDGYFLLTALDPEVQGIGGSTSGYNYYQDIIYGVQKPVEGSTVYEQIYGQNDLQLSTSQAQVGQTIYCAMDCVNYTNRAITVTVSLKFTPANGGNAVYATGARVANFPTSAAFSEWPVRLPSSLADGIYTVTPCFETSTGEWRDIPTGLAYTGTATANVSNGTITFSEASKNLSITNVTNETPFYIGSEYNVKADVTNPGTTEYYGGIALALIDSTGNIVGLGATYPIDLMGGETTSIDYASTFSAVNGATISAGTHYICFIDPSTGKVLSQMSQIDLKAATETSISSTAPVVEDADAVDPDNITVTATVNCTAGYYGGPLSLVFFPHQYGSVRSVGSLSGGTVFINAGDSKQVTFSGPFQGAESGKEYMCGIYAGQQQISNLTVFTIKDASGTATITADTTPAEYFDLRGIRIGEPKHGDVLIKRQGNTTQKVIF